MEPERSAPDRQRKPHPKGDLSRITTSDDGRRPGDVVEEVGAKDVVQVGEGLGTRGLSPPGTVDEDAGRGA